MLKGTARQYPTEFAEQLHLSRIINAELGYIAVTPWTLDELPTDDIDELLYVADLRHKMSEMEKEKKERNAQTHKK